MILGLMSLEEGGRVDFARLRGERLARLRAAMEQDGLDVLVLGRPGNARYASGARQLWTAGTRPFAPSCVVVAETGQVHLLSVWDEGVPAEISRSNFFGISWNPLNLMSALQRIPGMAGASRAGTDSMTPLFAQLLPMALPKAELVDATSTLSRVRTVKTPDELAAIATAAGLAEAALSSLAEAARPGVSELQLVGTYLETLSRLGAPTPSSEAVAVAYGSQGHVRPRQLATDRRVAPGDLVTLSPGALYAGYEAVIGRTLVAGKAPTAAQRGLAAEAAEIMSNIVQSCRPGASGADLVAAWSTRRNEPPAWPLAHGTGLGSEAPVITPGRGEATVLAPGMVLALQVWLGTDGVGGVLERETVAVGQDGPEVITRFGRLMR